MDMDKASRSARTESGAPSAPPWAVHEPICAGYFSRACAASCRLGASNVRQGWLSVGGTLAGRDLRPLRRRLQTPQTRTLAAGGVPPPRRLAHLFDPLRRQNPASLGGQL